jgi:hypothetical protein
MRAGRELRVLRWAERERRAGAPKLVLLKVRAPAGD